MFLLKKTSKHKLPALMVTIAASLAAFSFPAHADQELSGDEKDSCGALLCLSSGAGRGESECQGYLRRYFSIKFTRPDKTFEARRDFLSICPTDSDPVFTQYHKPALINAIARGAGNCDAKFLNSLNKAYYEKKIVDKGWSKWNTIDFKNRNFSVLLQSIPPEPTKTDNLRGRLSRWCRSENGRYAWCLDNQTNEFNPDDFYRIGFDLTDILKNDYLPTEPVLAYLFFLRSLMMDRVAVSGGIMATVVEEFWYPARFEITQDFMLKILKTDRKLGGWVILTSQSPEDAINSPIFAAIVQQTPTKIFLPNPDARYKGSYDQCGITQKEFDELVKLTLESRTFLIRQSRQSAFATLNLYGFDDEMTVLSGSSDNVAILDEVKSQMGDVSVDMWYPVFKDRVREAKQAKRQKAA